MATLNTLIEFLSDAWQRRQTLVDSNAFRAFSGLGEGIPGLVVDRYDRVIVLHRYEGESSLSREELKSIGQWYLENTPVVSVYLKEFISDRSRQVAEKELYSPVPFLGETSPEVFAIEEKGMKFLIRPYAGFSTGIFLDQRENRSFLGLRSTGKKVLNLFAYTGGFSVAAARSGASVTTVDLSSKYLEWAKENFRVNSLIPQEHVFVRADAMEFLERLTKRNETYDRIIIDPPSFSRNDRGKVFSIQKDYKRLWERAARCLAPQGELFFSSNYVPWNSRWLKEEAVSFWKGKGSLVPLPAPPVDFSREARPLSAILIKFD